MNGNRSFLSDSMDAVHCLIIHKRMPPWFSENYSRGMCEVQADVSGFSAHEQYVAQGIFLELFKSRFPFRHGHTAVVRNKVPAQFLKRCSDFLEHRGEGRKYDNFFIAGTRVSKFAYDAENFLLL